MAKTFVQVVEKGIIVEQVEGRPYLRFDSDKVEEHSRRLVFDEIAGMGEHILHLKADGKDAVPARITMPAAADPPEEVEKVFRTVLPDDIYAKVKGGFYTGVNIVQARETLLMPFTGRDTMDLDFDTYYTAWLAEAAATILDDDMEPSYVRIPPMVKMGREIIMRTPDADGSAGFTGLTRAQNVVDGDNHTINGTFTGTKKEVNHQVKSLVVEYLDLYVRKLREEGDSLQDPNLVNVDILPPAITRILFKCETKMYDEDRTKVRVIYLVSVLAYYIGRLLAKPIHKALMGRLSRRYAQGFIIKGGGVDFLFDHLTSIISDEEVAEYKRKHDCGDIPDRLVRASMLYMFDPDYHKYDTTVLACQQAFYHAFLGVCYQFGDGEDELLFESLFCYDTRTSIYKILSWTEFPRTGDDPLPGGKLKPVGAVTGASRNPHAYPRRLGINLMRAYFVMMHKSLASGSFHTSFMGGHNHNVQLNVGRILQFREAYERKPGFKFIRSCTSALDRVRESDPYRCVTYSDDENGVARKTDVDSGLVDRSAYARMVNDKCSQVVKTECALGKCATKTCPHGIIRPKPILTELDDKHDIKVDGATFLKLRFVYDNEFDCIMPYRPTHEILTKLRLGPHGTLDLMDVALRCIAAAYNTYGTNKTAYDYVFRIYQLCVAEGSAPNWRLMSEEQLSHLLRKVGTLPEYRFPTWEEVRFFYAPKTRTMAYRLSQETEHHRLDKRGWWDVLEKKEDPMVQALNKRVHFDFEAEDLESIFNQEFW